MAMSSHHKGVFRPEKVQKGTQFNEFLNIWESPVKLFRCMKNERANIICCCASRIQLDRPARIFDGAFVVLCKFVGSRQGGISQRITRMVLKYRQDLLFAFVVL